jgi:hypothetical protein
MKRYVCTVAAGLLLALASTATASANDLPALGQSGTQETSFGDQSVGEQTNYADVTQAQGNGNIALSPAIAIGGDAETTNMQGNDNTATADVDQENDVDQTQSSSQYQSLDSSGSSCCDGQSQTGEQSTYGGDQSVDEQKNDADVDQWQGNGNIAVAPAIAVFGDAETTNYQGNGNEAKAYVDQKNSVDQSQTSHQRQSLESSGLGRHCCTGSSQTGEQSTYGGDQSVDEQKNDADVDQWQGNGNVWIGPAIAIGGDASTRNYQGNHNTAKADVDQNNEVDQSQSSTQKQDSTQEGGGCCKTTSDCKPSRGCEPRKGYGKKSWSRKDCCESRSSQTGEQKTSFGDQTVGRQKNDADVTQKQGNWNGLFAPALAFGGGKHDSCYSRCEKSWHSLGGDAETTNYQGNGNEAKAYVDQKNSVDQSQTSDQRQTLADTCRGLIYR